MGAVVAAVVTAVSSAFGGFSITGFLSQRLLGGAISFGLSSLSRGLAGKPKGEARGSVARGLTETLRQAVTERRVIYGTSRVGGTMVALGTGEDQKYLYIAVVLASHEVAGIDTVYFNDDSIFADMIDGSGMVTSGTYANVTRIEKMNGADAQSANSNMLAEISEWTSDHRLQGVAYLYVRLEYDRNAYPGGIPNIRATSAMVVSGAVRVWLDVTGGVNTHTTPGGALFDYDTFLDTRDLGSYDGYESWDIGERSDFRYCKSRIALDMNAGPSYLTRFHLVADAPARTETPSVNVTGGSASVSFATPFLTPPLCRVSNAESNTNIAGCSAVTATGFTASLLTPLGAPASGIIIYDATGV